MEAILARRYAFCDFSCIHGFPNLILDREVWEPCLPRFGGNEHDHLGEHLLDFHECMHMLNIDHEDVLIKMLRFSLEGHAREWCRTLPVANNHSLKDSHTEFNGYCKQRYYVDFLYEECCIEFDILYKKNSNFKDQSASSEEIVEEVIVPHFPQLVSHAFQSDILFQEIGIEENNQTNEIGSSHEIGNM
jgi:hypothetical protein